MAAYELCPYVRLLTFARATCRQAKLSNRAETVVSLNKFGISLSGILRMWNFLCAVYHMAVLFILRNFVSAIFYSGSLSADF
jgi:hypothetical protein